MALVPSILDGGVSILIDFWISLYFPSVVGSSSLFYYKFMPIISQTVSTRSMKLQVAKHVG